MESKNTTLSHFVLFPILPWGHLRPFCTLATRLVREQENIIVTFIVAPQVLDKARTELSRQLLGKPGESSKALQRIRILSPSLTDLNLNGLDPPDPMNVFGDAYPATYQTVYQAKPITCSSKGTTFNAVPAPCAAIVDHLNLPQLRVMRAISGHSVPIITFMAAGAGAIIRLYGPESMGGEGNISARIDAEAARTGLSIDDICYKMKIKGKLVQIPGLPAMYDYEFFPQTVSRKSIFHKITKRGYNSFRECDAIMVSTSYIYESASLDAMKQWFFDMQKKVHVLGPLLPPGYGTEGTEEGMTNDIQAFLKEMLAQHGKRSVFFFRNTLTS